MEDETKEEVVMEEEGVEAENKRRRRGWRRNNRLDDAKGNLASGDLVRSNGRLTKCAVA